LGLQSENKCIIKAQKENGEHIPQSVEDRTLKYLTLIVVESREHNKPCPNWIGIRIMSGIF